MSSPKRVDTANRLIHAFSHAVYQALIDPDGWVQWLPPEGMTGELSHFEAREGGTYELILTYAEPGYGKSSDTSDITRGTFVELVPGNRMVQLVEFTSDQEEFAGIMQMSWVITPEGDGCRVTILAEDVPVGISPEDHEIGMQSTLENLAKYLELK